MIERLESRQRRREMMITLAFSIFTGMMLVVSNIEKWPLFYLPVLVAELVYVWWCYAMKLNTYELRAFIITSFTTLNMFLYGVQAGDFFVIIPTLCVEFVLLSLYEIPRILDVVIVKSVLLFLYHLMIEGYIFPTDQTLRNRIMLQTVSYVILISLCLYRIHHHRQEEEDVIILESKVMREQQILEDFIANTSHELMTPVNSVSGLCEIILQRKLSDDIQENMNDLKMLAVELQDIVTDILDFASLQANSMVLHPSVYNITSTINDVMNMAIYENKEKNLELIFDCDPNIPYQLEGDELQLKRVLNNLIGNAIKYTHEGGVVVRVTFRPEEYGINLIVSVKDTGIGMSDETQELSTRIFYRSDMRSSRLGSGLGLGLPIASGLIRLMGGFLIIKSEPGLGSEFSFAIPQKVVSEKPCITLLHPASVKLIWYCNAVSSQVLMKDAFADSIRNLADSFGIVSHRATSLEECKRRIAQGQVSHLIIGKEEYLQDRSYFNRLSENLFIILLEDNENGPKVHSRIHVIQKPYSAVTLADMFNGSPVNAEAIQKPQGKRFIAPTGKILIVDDSVMNLKVIEGLLKQYRVQVVTATSGEEALSKMKSQDFDFVLMDHMMPGMDGVECFHRIREMTGSYFTQVPVIAFTANAVPGSREMFLSEGFSELMAKPIDTAFLNELLYRFIPSEKQLPEDENGGGLC